MMYSKQLEYASIFLLVALFIELLSAPLLHSQVVGGTNQPRTRRDQAPITIPPQIQAPSTPTQAQAPSTPTQAQAPSTPTQLNLDAKNRDSDEQAIKYRVAALEAGRQDLSAWATLLVCIISTILAANVGLSVWQVRGLTQTQVDKLRTKYDKQFSGFLTRSQENLVTKIAAYESSIASLASEMDRLTPTFEGYIKDTTTAADTVRKDIEASLEQLRKEGAVIRQALQDI